MPRVTFTPHLQRFLDAPPAEVAGGTVREALESVFAANPRLRGYVVAEVTWRLAGSVDADGFVEQW